MTRRNLALLALIVPALTAILILGPAAKTSDRLNQDGVRSDVAAAIRDRYAYSSEIQKAVTQVARVLQKAIDRPEDADTIEVEMNHAISCLRGFTEPDDVHACGEIVVDLEGLVANTWARSRAYLKYNARLSGGTYDVSYADLKKCTFGAK